MNKVKVGKIVRFRDEDGKFNGGLVKDLVRENNVEYAIINTLDSEMKKVKKVDLTLVAREQRGRVSTRFLNELREEIRKDNDEIGEGRPGADSSASSNVRKSSKKKLSPQEYIEELEQNLASRDRTVKEYKKRINELEEENAKLKPGGAGALNVENLVRTVKALDNALLAAAKDNVAEIVLELTTLINTFNGIEN